MALALDPLAAALGLEMALGHIVEDRETGNMVHRVLFGNITRLGADHDGELDLPIERLRAFWTLHVIIRATDGTRRLAEKDGLIRDGVAGLLGMVGIVQPDADDLADLADASADPKPWIEPGQISRIMRADLV